MGWGISSKDDCNSQFFDKKLRKITDYFWNAKRLQLGSITLQRQNNYGELPKLVKGTHC